MVFSCDGPESRELPARSACPRVTCHEPQAGTNGAPPSYMFLQLTTDDGQPTRPSAVRKSQPTAALAASWTVVRTIARSMCRVHPLAPRVHDIVFLFLRFSYNSSEVRCIQRRIRSRSCSSISSNWILSARIRRSIISSVKRTRTNSLSFSL